MAFYERSSPHALIANYPCFNQLATDTFSVTAAGIVHGEAPTQSLKFAQRHGMRTFAVVSNFGATDFSPTIAHSILTNPVAVRTVIAGSLAALSANRYTGLDIDFESVPAGDRTAFSAFAAALAQTLHRHGFKLAISVPAMLRDDPGNSWTGAFDLAALGKCADLLQYMTYDEHGPWSASGPVAGFDWVRNCVRYAVSAAPSGKISLGLPAYGYDWNLTKKTGSQIPWSALHGLRTANQTAVHWDRSSSSPYLTYASRTGESHVVWYENDESISIKMSLVARYSLGGVSVYALGMENRAFWNAVDSTSR